MPKMSSDKITIAIFGTFKNGKSTLINCLTHSNVAEVDGMGRGFTHTNIRYTFGTSENITIVNVDGSKKVISKEQYYSSKQRFGDYEIIIESNCNSLKYFDVIDTPGFNANEHDTNMAESLYEKVDFAILLLRNKGVSEQEISIAKKLTVYNIPFTCIINCFDDIFDNWNPCAEQNEIIKKYILAELDINSIRPISMLEVRPVYVVNLMWYWLSLGIKSQNRSILLSEKKVRKFWDEIIGTTDYSATRLKHASGVESFLRILKHKKLRNYLIALNSFKDVRRCCTSIILESKKTNELKYDIISNICEEISSAVEVEKRQISQQLDSFMKRKKENDELSMFSLKYIFNVLLLFPCVEAKLKHRLNYLEEKKESLITSIKTI